MEFGDSEVECRPGHCARTWQSCNYYVRGVHLFHERTHLRTLPRSRRAPTRAELAWLMSGDVHSTQWFGFLGNREEIEELAGRHGGFAHEDLYPEHEGQPLFFLAFNDTDQALAFCHTADFDLHALSMAKLPTDRTADRRHCGAAAAA